MNLIAIDHGDKYLGLAVSFDKGMALGFKTILNDHAKGKALEEILKIVKDNEIDKIIIGYPKSEIFNNHNQKFHNLESKKNSLTQTAKVDRFIEKLKNYFQSKDQKIEIETFDEKMTSKLASRYSSKENEHQEAARIILDDWLKIN
jgi:putative Holliday junction resolvase